MLCNIQCIFLMQQIAVLEMILEFVAKLMYSIGSCFLRIIYAQYSAWIYMTKTLYNTRISFFILVHSESIRFHNYECYHTRFRGYT